MLDTYGNEVEFLSLGHQTAGIHNVALDVSDLHEGMYLCALHADGHEIQTIRILIKR